MKSLLSTCCCGYHGVWRTRKRLRDSGGWGQGENQESANSKKRRLRSLEHWGENRTWRPGPSQEGDHQVSASCSQKKITISLYIFCSDVTINKIDCDKAESQNVEKVAQKATHKDSTSIKKEIIGILKPPNLKKELKSFPSLPECFLHDLGLLDNLALR